MTDTTNENSRDVIEGRIYDEPLILSGYINTEPERYVAEKPFDLTRFEYSILKKPYQVDFWFGLVAGATSGIVIAVVGKAIAALIEKQNPSLESWEICAIAIGVIASLVLKTCVKSEEDKEKGNLIKVIDGHFHANRPRHLHLTGRNENEN